MMTMILNEILIYGYSLPQLLVLLGATCTFAYILGHILERLQRKKTEWVIQ